MYPSELGTGSWRGGARGAGRGTISSINRYELGRGELPILMLYISVVYGKYKPFSCVIVARGIEEPSLLVSWLYWCDGMAPRTLSHVSNVWVGKSSGSFRSVSNNDTDIIYRTYLLLLYVNTNF